MQRGEIWWAEFPPPVYRHPVVVISRNRSAEGRKSIVVAQITARVRHSPAEVPLGADDGLPKTVINAEMISTVAPKDLVSRITRLSPAKMADLDQALCYALDLANSAKPNGLGNSEESHRADDGAAPARPRLPVRQSRHHFAGSSFSKDTSH